MFFSAVSVILSDKFKYSVAKLYCARLLLGDRSTPFLNKINAKFLCYGNFKGYFCHLFKIDNHTLSSKAPTPRPDAAPEPARPIKCSLPMLLANSDAPTNTQVIFLPARKYESTVFRL